MGNVEDMRRLMYRYANYNWTFCYRRTSSKIEDTFKHDFPNAYEKLVNNENVTRLDMISK